jgi:NADH-quinone oxidoreductase subunit L
VWLRTFFGPARRDGHPHEAGPVMLVPVVLLAVPAALLGLAGLAAGFAHRLGGTDLVRLNAATLPPLACLVAGVLLAWALWRRDPASDPALFLGRAAPVLANAFYLDAVQYAAVVRPVRRLAALVRRADESIVDGAVESAGRRAVDLGEAVSGWHRAAMPRAAATVLGGALLIGLAAVLLVGAR